MATIFILSNASGYGGSERSVELLSVDIANHNKLIIFVENKKHYENLILKSSDFHIILLKDDKNLFFLISNFIRLVKEIYFQKPDLILANTNKAAFYLGILGSFIRFFSKKTKKAFFVRDYSWKFKWIIKKILFDARLCIPSKAVSEYASYFNSNQIVIADPIDLVPKKEVLKDSQDKKIEIISVAMISRWKGIEYLIEACALIEAKNYVVKIIGDSADLEYLNELKKLVQNLNLTDNVEFISYTNDINQYFEKADIVTITSVSDFGGPETFGRTIIEAWNFSKAVVAFDCGGPSYIIENNVSGLLIKEKDILGLSKALSLLIKDQNLRLNLGFKGREVAEKKYQVNIIAKEICELVK